MELFAQAQEKWSESLLSEEVYCDAVAILGLEAQRVPFIRPLLACLSQPLKALLYGSFQEAKAREVSMPDVTPAAFDVMLRSACHVNPELTAERAIQALQAAKLYMIDALESHCLSYLRALKEPGAVLRAMTAAAKASFCLPIEVQHSFWCNLLFRSQEVLESPAFLEAHGSIISRLIQLEEFQVAESRLWSRLLDWTLRAVQQPELLGSYADLTAVSSEKRLKSPTEALGGNEQALQEAILREMSKHIRFVAMSKDFFFDKARRYLSREDSEAVMMYWLGRRSPDILALPRGGLVPVEQAQHAEIILLDGLGKELATSEEVKNLVCGCGDWAPSSYRILMLRMPRKICLTRIELTYGLGEHMLVPSVSLSSSAAQTSTLMKGRVRHISFTASAISDTVRLQFQQVSFVSNNQVAKLSGITLLGKNLEEQQAKDVVDRLAAQLIQSRHESP